MLRAVLAQSEVQGFDRHIWQLVWTGFDLIDRFYTWRDWMWALTGAQQAAARLGEHLYVARLMYLEAVAIARLGHYEDARQRFTASEDAYAQIGDVPGQVRSQTGQAWTLILLDRPHESLEVAQAALDLQRRDASATARLVGMAMHQVAEGLGAAGEYQKALECCAELKAVRRGIENPYDSGNGALTEGAILVGLGESGPAIEVLASAIGWFNQVGSWSDIANAQRWLGEAYEQAGDLTAARLTWIESLATYEHHQHPYAEKVRAKLAALPEN
ncbi:MAG TPA: hypothetical protein VF821_17760 [Lentzea sp.]